MATNYHSLKDRWIDFRIRLIPHRPFLRRHQLRRISKGHKTLKAGDILKVKTAKKPHYFQFLYLDADYMAGHLIRAFQYSGPNLDNPADLHRLYSCPVQFYTYTRVFEGIKHGLWDIVGHIPLEGGFKPPIFRSTDDLGGGDSISDKWYLWCGRKENRIRLGLLNDKYKNYQEDAIFPPEAVVKWITTGHHGYTEAR